MFYKMKTFYNPINFHGEGKNNYFEGWYYKISFKNRTIAFIPGISINNKDSMSFIQVIDSKSNKSDFIKFPIEDFKFSKKHFEIKIKDNVFTKNKININLDNYKCDLKISSHIIPLKNFFYPGVMGPYSYIPFMECNHGIMTMKSKISGIFNDQQISGVAYIEKDWGTSFPKGWIWSQGFDNETSFSISVAKIPFMKRNFVGFLIFILHKNRMYRFTTYNFSKILKLTDSGYIEIKKGKYLLKIKVNIENSSKLKAPSFGEMINHIDESLKSKVNIDFISDNEILFSKSFSESAAEIENIQLLLH